jgi:hypothetical protein
VTGVTALTAPSVPAAPRRLESASALIVAALAIVGILATLGLRTMIESGAATISQGGISASVPQAWRIDAGTGGVAFIASNPSNLDQRYLARVVDPGGLPIEQVASRETAAKASLKSGYVKVETHDVTIGGTAGIAVGYAYVAASGGTATMIRGEDIFVPSGGKVMDLSYEAPSDVYATGIDTFHAFVGSARVAS